LPGRRFFLLRHDGSQNGKSRRSENIDLWIVGVYAEAMDLRLRTTIAAEVVEADAVLLKVDQGEKASSEMVDLGLFEVTLENGILHAGSEVLERGGEMVAAPVVGDVVGDDDQEGHSRLS
jgi:hypothetical protein